MSNGDLVPVSQGPREWKVERMGTAVRPASPENEKARRIGKGVEKGVLPMAGLWFASLIFSFPDVVSSILFGLTVSLFILSTVLVSWKRPKALTMTNRAVIEAVNGGHRSQLLDFFIENPKSAENMDVHDAIMLWEKSSIVGGNFEMEVHAMLMSMAKKNLTAYPKKQKTITETVLQSLNLAESGFNNDNAQIRMMLAKANTLVVKRQRIEAAAAGVDAESVIDPVRWSFNRALESAKHEDELLGSVEEDIKKQKEF